MITSAEQRERIFWRCQLTPVLRQELGRNFTEAEMERRVTWYHTRDRMAVHVADCGFYGATASELAKAFLTDGKTAEAMVASLIRRGRIVESSRHRISDTGKPLTVLVATNSPSKEAGN